MKNRPPSLSVSALVIVLPDTADYLTRIAVARGEPLGRVVGSILDRYVAGDLIEWIPCDTDPGDLFIDGGPDAPPGPG